MPVSPDYAAGLAKGIRDIYAHAQERVLEMLAKSVSRGIDGEHWQDQKLLDLQAFLRQLDGVLDDLAHHVPGAVERAMRIAYNRGTAAAGADLAKAGATAAYAEAPAAPAVTALVSADLNALKGTTYQVTRWARDVYQQVTVETSAQVLTGVTTRRVAARDALRKYAARGITGFVDKSGRAWDLVSYAEMATRSTAGQAMLEGHADRLKASGHDLVIVSNAPEECKLCRPYEGEVLSLSGSTLGTLKDGTRVMASIAEAKGDGLFHPNCRHSTSLYIPGHTKKYTDTADPQGDQLRQQQRAYERRVRDWKRRVIIDENTLGKNDPRAKQTRAKLRAVQHDFKQFRDSNDRKNLSYRTSLHNR